MKLLFLHLGGNKVLESLFYLHLANKYKTKCILAKKLHLKQKRYFLQKKTKV